jgi:hypothetical protein
MQPLGYASAQRFGPPKFDPGRLPGSFIAIGVISVLWGVVALIANLKTIPDVKAAYRQSIPPTASVASYPAPTFAAFDGDIVAPSGMPLEARLAAVSAVNDRLKLSADRKLMLEWFLADAGKDIFSGSLADPATFASQIQNAQPAEQDADGSHPDVFTTLLGRVEIRDTSVVLQSGSGGQTQLQETILTLPNGQQRWSSQAIKAAVLSLQNVDGSPATPMQTAAIALRMATFRVIAGRPGSFPPVPIARLNIRRVSAANGAPLPPIYISDGSLGTEILPDGRAIPESAYKYGTDAAGLPKPPPPAAFRPALPGSLAAIALLPYEAEMNAALALMLLFAGLMLMGGMPGAAQFCKIWAALRIVCGVWSFMLGKIYLDSIGPNPSAALGGVLAGILVALIFPIVMLIVLRGRRATAYFAARGRNTTLLPESIAARWKQVAGSAAGRSLLLLAMFAALVAGVMHLQASFSGSTTDSEKLIAAGWFVAAFAVIGFACVQLATSLQSRNGVGPALAAVAAMALLLAGPKDVALAADAASNVATFKAVAADEKKDLNRRYDALRSLMKLGDSGLEAVESIAAGEGIFAEEKSAPAPWEETDLRRKNNGLVRHFAIELLTFGNAGKPFRPQTVAALKTAVKNGRTETSEYAAKGMAIGGRDSIAGMIDLVRDELPESEFYRIARVMPAHLGYPLSLSGEPNTTEKTHREAAAKLMTFLLEHYRPNQRFDDVDKVAQGLQKIAEGNDSELSRQAVATIRYDQRLVNSIRAGGDAKLMQSPSPGIADIGRRSALAGNPPVAPSRVPSGSQARSPAAGLTEAQLIGMLSSTDRSVKQQAINRLFIDLHHKVESRRAILEQLQSPDPDVRKWAGYFVQSADSFRGTLGPASLKTIYTDATGRDPVGDVLKIGPERIAWPATQPPPATALPGNAAVVSEKASAVPSAAYLTIGALLALGGLLAMTLAAKSPYELGAPV